MSALHEQPQLALLFDPTCRAIFEKVARQPLSARMLARDLGLAPAEASRRLGKLVRGGLVATDGEGTYARYRIDPVGMAAMHHALEAAWARRVSLLLASLMNPRRPAPHRARGGPR